MPEFASGASAQWNLQASATGTFLPGSVLVLELGSLGIRNKVETNKTVQGHRVAPKATKLDW
jgi:hypothetical protein